MLKRIFLFLVMLALVAYLVMAVTMLNRKPAEQICHDMELIIKDSVHAGFINKKEITNILQNKGIYPVGRKLNRISTKLLENELNKHPLIDRVECYKTPNGKLCVEINQRIPILRVISNNGENYYIDNKGSIMSPEAKCIAHLVIATGNIEKSFAMRYLYKFGVFLQNNPFWDAQIEQINVLPEKDIELVPRVGEHIVYLSRFDDFEEKLVRLKIFYEKALNQVGWNKYSRISLEFANQIICTKKEHGLMRKNEPLTIPSEVNVIKKKVANER